VITLLKLRPYPGDLVVPSPNHGARRAPAIKGIVLHATADAGNEAQSLTWLRSPKSGASCHLFVGRSGRVTRLVGDRQRAWHAGQASWRGVHDVNSVTLGIEIANRNDGEPFTERQYQRVADIVAHYCRQGLSLDDVVSHGEIAATRRTDPFGWDWKRFRAMVRHRLHAAAVASPRHTPTRTKPTHANESHAVATPTAAPSRAVATAKPQRGTIAASRAVRRRRTAWLSGATLAASGGLLAADTLDLTHKFGMALPEHFGFGMALPEHFGKWALFAVGLLSLLLRWRATLATDSRQGDDRTPAGTGP